MYNYEWRPNGINSLMANANDVDLDEPSWFNTNPSAGYCVGVGAGYAFGKNNSSNREFSAGVGLDVLGVMAYKSYSSSMSILWKDIPEKSYLCGSTSDGAVQSPVVGMFPR